MQEDIVVFEALFAHNGGTNLAETYSVSPTATIENEARWNGGAVGIWNLIARVLFCGSQHRIQNTSVHRPI